MMSYPKFLVLITVGLFTAIAGLAALKKKQPQDAILSKGAVSVSVPMVAKTEVVELEAELRPADEPAALEVVTRSAPREIATPLLEVDRISQLFNTGEPKLPIVETIAYRSRVAWHKGAPAWLADYASYYKTSRHFIARSLNGTPDYFKQNVAEGDRINVFRKDKEIAFNLTIDTSRCLLWFYYTDLDTGEKVLLKTYQVSLGRPDSNRASGFLTPHGKYQLGNKVAIYNTKSLGIYNNQRIEMIRVFGTRWIPFEREIEGCTAPAKGLGLHGVPWDQSSAGDWMENSQSIGKYESDGCVRLATADVEEIYSIVITKPTYVELVAEFNDFDTLK